jgi:hypothetical protein
MPDFSQLVAQPNDGANFYAATMPQFQSNLPTAASMLKLSPQEMALYQRHLSNLLGPGGVDHPDGSRSTLYQSVQEHNGKYYNVPTVFDGQILTEKDPRTGIDVPNAEALKRIEQEGWDKFPAYDTPEQADARYGAMHSFMDQDTSQYLSSRK